LEGFVFKVVEKVRICKHQNGQRNLKKNQTGYKKALTFRLKISAGEEFSRMFLISRSITVEVGP
jgi:hypothetical protein